MNLKNQLLRTLKRIFLHFFGENELSLKTYNLIKDADYSYFADYGIEIINAPGHTPGSIILKTGNYLFTGDLLFKGAIGRTDLPGGNTVQIKKSLAKIKKMDRQLIIYPGHGESSSLEYELESNYYLEECFLREGTKKEKGDLL